MRTRSIVGLAGVIATLAAVGCSSAPDAAAFCETYDRSEQYLSTWSDGAAGGAEGSLTQIAAAAGHYDGLGDILDRLAAASPEEVEPWMVQTQDAFTQHDRDSVGVVRDVTGFAEAAASGDTTAFESVDAYAREHCGGEVFGLVAFASASGTGEADQTAEAGQPQKTEEPPQVHEPAPSTASPVPAEPAPPDDGHEPDTSSPVPNETVDPVEPNEPVEPAEPAESAGTATPLAVCVTLEELPEIDLEAELLSEIAQRRGYDLSERVVDFASITGGIAFSDGVCDLAASAITVTPEREEIIEFTQPHLTDPAPYAFAFPLGSGPLRSEFDQAIADIRADGTWDELVARHLD